MDTPDLRNKNTYSFDVYPTAFIGNNYKNVYVMGILTREMAEKEIDTAAMHIQVYNTLPTGTPNSPDAYDYVKLKFPDGSTRTIGLAWIKAETVELTDARTITVKIGNAMASDVARIRNALVQNQFNNLEFSID